MTKLFGACMVAAAGALCCLNKLGESRGREAELRALINILKAIRGKLEAERSALPEMLSALEKSAADIERNFFSTAAKMCELLGELEFSEIWRISLKCFSFLEREERISLEALGAVLGRYRLEAQLCELEKCISAFEGSLAEFTVKRRAQDRLWVEMTAAACAMIVTVLA